MDQQERINRIAKIANRSPITVIVWKSERDWPVEMVTDNILELTGYSAQDFVEGITSYVELIHPDDIRRVRDEIDYYSGLPECSHFNHAPYRLKHRSGHLIWVEDYTQVLRDSTGKVTSYEGVIVDCSPRIMAESALHEREQYVNDIEKLSGIASGEYLPEINRIYSSPNLARLLNTEESDQNQTFDTIEFAIHPKDRKRVLQKHKDFMEGIFPYTITYQIISHDGEVRLIQERAKIEIDDFHSNRALLTFLDLTDIEKTKKQIQETKQNYFTLFENAPVPLWQEDVTQILTRFDKLRDMGVSNLKEYVDINKQEFLYLISLNKVDYINNAAMQLHDVSAPEDLIDHLSDFFSEKSHDGLLFVLNELFKGKQKGTVLTELLTSSGDPRQVLLSFCLLERQDNQKKLIISTVDISRRVQAEQQVSILTTAVEQNPVAIVITDLDGAIEYVNPTFTRVTGYSYEDAIGQNPNILKSDYHDKEIYREMWETIKDGGEWHGVLRNKCKDGSLIWEDVAIAPVRDNDGTIVRYLAVKEDITEKRALEQQFLQAQKMESIGRLASGIAHDFNNILTVITGYAELLHSEIGEKGDYFDDVLEIEEASAQAARLARQLLAFSRKEVVNPESINLEEILDTMSKMLHRVVPENIILEVVTTDHDHPIMADPGQIEQLLMNLIVNSVDAIGREKDGKILISTEKITKDESFTIREDTFPAGDYFELKITDTGCGINEEVQEHMFEPFFTTKAADKGTGLGMATVSDILRRYKAACIIDSKIDIGTTFNILWPINPRNIPTVEQTNQQPLEGTERVLFVEDDIRIRSMVTQRLHSLGYTVFVAGDGDEAIQFFKKNEDGVDLVITDLVMPGKGGLELAAFLAKNFPKTPIIFSSGYVDTTIPKKFRSGKIDNFVQKPYSITTLTTKIRKMLD